VCVRVVQKRIAILEGFHSSPAYPSGKSSVKIKMAVQHWWNITEENPKYLEKCVLQYHLVRHNPTWTGLVLTPELRRYRPSNNAHMSIVSRVAYGRTMRTSGKTEIMECIAVR
jgi:hypothetical protein